MASAFPLQACKGNGGSARGAFEHMLGKENARSAPLEERV